MFFIVPFSQLPKLKIKKKKYFFHRDPQGICRKQKLEWRGSKQRQQQKKYGGIVGGENIAIPSDI